MLERGLKGWAGTRAGMGRAMLDVILGGGDLRVVGWRSRRGAASVPYPGDHSGSVC